MDQEKQAVGCVVTKNELIVQGLRELADYVEAHPELPSLTNAFAYGSDYGDSGRETVSKANQILKKDGGTATADDYHVTVTKEFTGGVDIRYSVNRDAVCERITTWKCADAELMEALGLKKS